jgi:hypothetical protein
MYRKLIKRKTIQTSQVQLLVGGEIMCPRFNNGICDIAGIEPAYVGVCIWDFCYENAYESCKLYIVECLIINCESLLKAA